MFSDFIKDMWQIMYDKRIALKKKELADRIGITYNQLRDFMTEKYCSRNVAEKIADFLGMTMVYAGGKYRLVDNDKVIIERSV